MRTITKSEPIFYGPNNEHSLSMDLFVAWLLNSCPNFNSTGAQIRQAVRIETAFKAESPELSDEDWEALRKAANDPGCPYPLTPARACIQHIDAIDNAKVS